MAGINDLPNCCYDYRHEEKRVKIVDNCAKCGEFILEGNEYYDKDGKLICRNCISKYEE